MEDFTFWERLWTNLFGSVDGWFGIDWGFWISMIFVALVVVVENIVFWSMKPWPRDEQGNAIKPERKRKKQLEEVDQKNQ